MPVFVGTPHRGPAMGRVLNNCHLPEALNVLYFTLPNLLER
jgi:hypothetical protein